MVISGELILSQEPFIMIIRFRISLILPKLIVWCNSDDQYTKDYKRISVNRD